MRRDRITPFPKLYTPEGYVNEFLIYENLLGPRRRKTDTFVGPVETELTRMEFSSRRGRKEITANN